MLATLSTLITAAALTASPTTLRWEADYGKALTQTRGDSRPLLIVMDKPGVEDQQVPEALLSDAGDETPLAKYDLCHVDVTTEYGKAVAEAFRAKEFPYFAIIDKSGSVVLHRHAGVVTAENWNATLAKHQAGERAIRVTVAKPVVEETTTDSAATESEATTPVTIKAEPALSTTGYYESATPSYYAAPVNSYCPNCNRR